MFIDPILCVPKFFDKHELEHPLFQKEGPYVLEICSGNGEWICRRAAKDPKNQYIAVEMQLKRVRKIWSKRTNQSLDNLQIVYGQAQDFCQFYVPKNTFSEIYINFPDPWPKKRHAKHRLVQPEFIQILHTLLAPGGTLTIVTDDIPYGLQIQDTLTSALWCPLCGLYNSLEEYGESYFGRLWESLHRTVQFYTYEKVSL